MKTKKTKVQVSKIESFKGFEVENKAMVKGGASISGGGSSDPIEKRSALSIASVNLIFTTAIPEDLI